MFKCKTRIRCGLTMGDPSGIGAELILKALRHPGLSCLVDFVVIGDSFVLKKCQGVKVSKCHRASFIDLKNVSRSGFEFGKVSAEYGKASIEYLDRALELISSEEIDCLVTAPVSKEAVNLAGYKFSGHTEYIAAAFKVKDAAMLLLNQKLRVALVTRHIPLRDVAQSLSMEKILETISGAACGLRSFFGIGAPRLAVCALNPHGSDNGLIGDEEARLIIPAIKLAKAQGIAAEGPFPADTIFEKAKVRKYDCVVCMYHDQGLIPIKLTGFRDAVNLTLGLPFVRTSPGHGTGFDIAGKNKADAASLISAIKTAIQCFQKRA